MKQIKKAKISIDIKSYENGVNEIELVSQINLKSTEKILLECVEGVRNHMCKNSEEQEADYLFGDDEYV